MEIIKHILLFLILIDVISSVVSFIDNIPVGKAFFSPRFPLFITLLVILIQTKQRNRSLYCETCGKNLSTDEIAGRCICGAKTKLEFLGISGKILYKCSNKSCRYSDVISFNGNMRTRFSRLFPYKQSLQHGRMRVCNTCGKVLTGKNVTNFSLYCGDLELAKNYREDFFYHGFGPAKQTQEISVLTNNSSLLKEIDKHYEKGTTKLNLCNIPENPIRVRFKTRNENINQDFFQFNIAVAQNENLKLRMSDGIIILLNGNSSGIERQSIIDHFLVELRNINTESPTWQRPVLVGLCCNDVEELESAINSGQINSENDSEELCRNFLIAHNNNDILYSLFNYIENVHFFIYRTGTLALKNSDKVYNVVQPVQSLFYDSMNEFSHIWKPYSNGYCPKTTGHK